MKLGKNDYLSNVCISDKKDDILVYTKNGNCALFNFNDFETTSLNTKGVQSAKLSEDDSVIGFISYNKKMTELLTLTDRGYMKRLSIKALPKTKRAGKCIELSSTRRRGDVFDVNTIQITPDKATLNNSNIATQEYVDNLIGGVSAVLGNTEDLGV